MHTDELHIVIYSFMSRVVTPLVDDTTRHGRASSLRTRQREKKGKRSYFTSMERPRNCYQSMKQFYIE